MGTLLDQNRINACIGKKEKLLVLSRPKAIDSRHEQDRIPQSIEEHKAANQVYLDEGICIIELSRRVYELFIKKNPVRNAVFSIFNYRTASGRMVN